MLSPNFTNDNYFFSWYHPILVERQQYVVGQGYVTHKCYVHSAHWATNNLQNGSLFKALLRITNKALSVKGVA